MLLDYLSLLASVWGFCVCIIYVGEKLEHLLREYSSKMSVFSVEKYMRHYIMQFEIYFLAFSSHSL